MSEIRKCCGDFFVENSCPDCGESGDVILSSDERRKVSKFVSGLLRHFPDEYSLEVDDYGWAKTNDVVNVVKDKYPWMDGESLVGIIRTDEKGRFEVSGHEIRASYGHSIDVTIEEGVNEFPDELYHGTEPRKVDSIMKEGLKPMNRQKVHLSGSRQDAIKVGERHCEDPKLLQVDANSLDEQYKVTKQGKSVYTVDRVPPEFIEIVED